MRMQMTREFFIPKGAIKVADKNSDAVVYLYERIGKLFAMAFLPKGQKPAFHHSYRNPQSREKHVRDFFAGVTAHKAMIVERRKARSAPHTVEVGTIFYSSWGYEQTNVDFYQVTALVGTTMVEVRQIGADSKTTGHDTGTCVAVKDSFLERSKPTRHKVQMFDGKPSLRVDGHHASLWDGRPMRWSSYH
jgi:hypothetical protein